MSVEKALEWLAAAERPGGGIACWQNGHFHESYPEVTGYLIPTMLAYGLDDLAIRCADWLVSIQCDDGAFCGMDGIKRTFDTGAIVEGLEKVFLLDDNWETSKFGDALYQAYEWLVDQQKDDTALKITPDGSNTHIYTMRTSWIIGEEQAAEYWSPKSPWDPRWGEKQRPHYIAYALDGLCRMGYTDAVRMVLEASQSQPLSNGLMPLWSYEWSRGEGFCTTSTLQFAILYRRFDMPYRHLIEAAEMMQAPNGGFMHGADDGRLISWALKFYLDAKHDNYTV